MGLLERGRAPATQCFNALLPGMLVPEHQGVDQTILGAPTLPIPRAWR